MARGWVLSFNILESDNCRSSLHSSIYCLSLTLQQFDSKTALELYSILLLYRVTHLWLLMGKLRVSLGLFITAVSSEKCLVLLTGIGAYAYMLFITANPLSVTKLVAAIMGVINMKAADTIGAVDRRTVHSIFKEC